MHSSTSIPTEQNGARVRENGGEVTEDEWDFLGNGGNSKAAQAAITSGLKKISRTISAIDFMRSDDILAVFQSSVGFVPSGSNINPFLRNMAPSSPTITLQQFSRFGVEQLLREIALIPQMNSVQSVSILLSLQNHRIIRGIRRLLVNSFELHQEKWNHWRNFAAVKPTDLSNEQKLQAQIAFGDFWEVVDDLFAD
jgi:hypothetical protein